MSRPVAAARFESATPQTRTGCRARADILEGPTDRSYGQRELVVKDLNGMILAFGETMKPSSPQPA